ncbi:MAG: hypothetical protein WCA35_16485 [Kovacikia sp.]
MTFSTFPPATAELHGPTPRVLESRNQYRSCHIRLPGEGQRLAAILVNDKYYTLIKVVKDRQQALEIGKRLISKGKETLITSISKGSAIWTWEPDAWLDSPTRSQPGDSRTQINSPTCKILGTNSQTQTCQIRVPDLRDPLQAIVMDGKYYGLFKVVENRQQSLELAAKLGLRGDETVISKTPQGEAIWVLESDAVQI